uniref:Putative secreted protein n=1 Tax=Anopheles marajoara TaxID=58244 RepID=A0A2M4C7S6_9DIPT
MFHFSLSLSLALYIFYSFACAPHSSCCGGSKCNCISVDGMMQVRPSHTDENFKSSRPCSALLRLSHLSFSHGLRLSPGTHTRIVANFYAYDTVEQDILSFLSLSLLHCFGLTSEPSA